MAYETRKPPRSELERQMAIILCRINSWRCPLDGEPMGAEERRDETREYFRGLNLVVNDDVWSWMWNEGSDQWRPELGKCEGLK